MYPNDNPGSITPPSDSDNVKKEETSDLFNTTSYGNGVLHNVENGHDAVFGEVGEGDTNYRNVNIPCVLLQAMAPRLTFCFCRSVGSEPWPF